MGQATVELAFNVYGNPFRLARILEAFELLEGTKHFGLDKVTPPYGLDSITVYEDLSDDAASEGFRRLADSRGIQHERRPTWGCMQGNAQFTLEETAADWVLYFPDDLLPTPGAVEWAVRWCRVVPDHVGAIQLPYWNFEELTGRNRSWMFRGDSGWLRGVRWNPHWWGPAFYVNVNGAVFALRKKAWEAAGGFPTKTWCLDEHVSCRIWLHTDYTIVSVPGPPFVHAGGGSIDDQFRHGHSGLRCATLDGWMDEWGVGKDELGERCRARMRQWREKTGIPDR